MTEAVRARPSVCFVGINNLAALAPGLARQTPGGAELQQTLLARGLARLGFRVSMVVADLGQAERTAWDAITTHRAYRPDAGLPVIRFFHPRLTGVWAAMRRARADVYYCACAGLLPGQLALYAACSRRRVATVFRMAHDSDANRGGHLIPNLRGKALYRYGLPRMDLVLAQSELQRQRLRENWGMEAHVVNSLVDLPEWPPGVDRDIDLLWVSNLRPFKRPEMVLDLAESLPHLKVHMVGGMQPGLEGYFREVEQRAAGIPSVRFHGALPYAETSRLIARAKVLVNTSESEGFPNTYMQAWARGVPTVGTFDPDGVIAREKLGAAVGSAEELRAQVLRILGDSHGREMLGEHCRRYVERAHGTGALQTYARLIEDAWEAAR